MTERQVRPLGLFTMGALVLATGISCLCAPTPTPPATSTAPPTLPPFGAIIADDVPVRSGPGDEYDTVGTCNRGDIVALLGSEGEWYRVFSERFDADVWVYAKFVSPIVSRPLTPKAGEPTEPLPTPETPVLTLPPEPSPSATPTRTEAPTLPPPPTATHTPTSAPTPPLP